MLEQILMSACRDLGALQENNPDHEYGLFILSPTEPRTNPNTPLEEMISRCIRKAAWSLNLKCHLVTQQSTAKLALDIHNWIK